jgi:hypothetical protein
MRESNEEMTVSIGSCNRERYLGVEFVVWKNQVAWFWLVTSPSGRGGIIGASANEAQAMREARLSIEEKGPYFADGAPSAEYSVR